MQEKPHYKGKGGLNSMMIKRLRSENSNCLQALKLLRADLYNSPLHCFGVHTNCSTDFCKAAQKSSSSSSSLTVSSLSSQAIQDSSSTSIDYSSLSVDIRDIAEQEAEMWQDTVDDQNTEEIRVSNSGESSVDVDLQMICDIQQLVGRLIAKADQLLGKRQ